MISLLTTTVLSAALGCGGGCAATSQSAGPACNMAMPPAVPIASAASAQAPSGYRSYSYEPTTQVAPVSAGRPMYTAPSTTYRTSGYGQLRGWNSAGWKSGGGR